MIDNIDRKILTLLQDEFPLAERPYKILSEKVGLSEDEFLRRTKILLRKDIIRRLGLSLASREFGYKSTLAAIRVDPEDVEKASRLFDAFPEITHSYLRTDSFNVWFTLITRSQSRIEQILAQIGSALTLRQEDILNLPVTHLFKLDVRFDSRQDDPG